MVRDALVVGVNTYQNLPGLKAPARDAEAVAKILQTYGEFRVHRLPEVIQAGQPQIGQKTQVTLQMLESALVQLFKPKGRSVAQTALFYFSGHGLQREAGIREGFLAPSNADPDRGIYGLSLFWLRRLLQESPVRQRIIILDCCHSGELLNFLEADPGAAPETDRLFMAASREYETAYESIDSPYSIFTQALLTGLDPQRSPTGIVSHHALTDWVNDQLKGEIQQPLFESSGSEIILTRQVTRLESPPAETLLHSNRPGPSQLPPHENAVCPYRGLEYFDEPHAEYFFGRETLTAELLQKLKTDSFVAVVGASGVGKSSIVRAGLLPLLRQTHPNQRQPRQNQTYADWQIKLLTPGTHPLRSLAAAFVDPEANPIDRAEQLGRAEQLVQSGTAGFVQLVRGSLSQTFRSTGLLPKTRSQVLLVIDQFEEIFTRRPLQIDREKQQFIACITAALQDLSDCLKVLVVLRSDFLGHCRQYEPLAAQIAQHLVVVRPLKYEQLKAAIVRPAQKVGLRCEPNLVYTLLLDVMGSPGELALLQSILLELWNRRKPNSEGIDCLTLESYHELGGIRQLLPQRATALFHRFNSAEQAIAQRIFLSLTQFGEGTEDTRRRVLKSQLVSPALAPEKAELAERILEKLVSAKLLVTDQAGLNVIESSRQPSCPSSDVPSPGSCSGNLSDCGIQPIDPEQPSLEAHRISEQPAQAVVDVAHESLIRHWTLLRQWCDRDREMLRRQRSLEEAAQTWYTTGQPASVEFLLTGQRLQDAEKLLADRAQDFSALVQEYVLASRKEIQRVQRESRQLRIAVPACLVTMLAVVVGQSLSAIQAQTEKEQQLRQAAARERAAITQAILQQANSPTTALLIGRLAAQAGPSEVTQASLRQSLQSLRLQFELPAAQGRIQQLQTSADRKPSPQSNQRSNQRSNQQRSNQNYLAASTNGKIHLWSIQPYRLYSRTSPPQPGQILDWTIGTANPASPSAHSMRIAGIQFSPDGQSIAAFAEAQPDIKIWSTQYGALLLHLKGSAPVTQIRFSPSGEWLASVHDDRSLSIWRTDTGQLQTRLLQPQPIDQVQFTPDGQLLLSLANKPYRYRLMQAANHAQLQPVGSSTLPNATKANSSQASSIQADSAAASSAQKKPNSAEPVKQTVFSPQGRWIATLSVNEQVSLWQSQTGQLIDRFPAGSAAKMQFSPDDRQLSILTNNQVLLYDLATQRLRQIALLDSDSKRDSSEISANAQTQKTLTFSTDARWLVTRSWQTVSQRQQQIIQIWDGRSLKPVGLPIQDDFVTSVHFSPDNAYLITGDAAGRLKFWAVQIGGELPTLEQADSPTRWAAFLHQTPQSDATDSVRPRTTQLLTIAAHGQVQQWSLPVIPAPPAASPRTVPSVSIHTAALKPQNFWQKLTEFAAQKNLAEQEGTDLPFRPSGGVSSRQTTGIAADQAVHQSRLPFSVARAGWADSLAQLRNEATNRNLVSPLPAIPVPAKTPLASIAISADGQWIAAADPNGTIALQQRQPDQTFQVRYQIHNWQSNSPSTPTLALSQILSGQAGLATRSTNRRGVRIRQLSFSPDSKYLLGVGDDLTVRLWQVESGELVQVWRNHQTAIHQASFSSDGLHIITASQDKTAQILKVELGQNDSQTSSPPIAVLQHPTAVTSSSFSPDDRQIVTGSEDGQARVYDRTTDQLQRVLEGHQGTITDVQYSPDGKSILTASTDGTAIVWNAETGKLRTVLKPNPQQATLQPLQQAAFSPDGEYVMTLTQNGQVLLWAATWDHLLSLAQERTTRQLTAEECSRYLNLSSHQCPKLPTPDLSLPNRETVESSAQASL